MLTYPSYKKQKNQGKYFTCQSGVNLCNPIVGNLKNKEDASNYCQVYGTLLACSPQNNVVRGNVVSVSRELSRVQCSSEQSDCVFV